MKIRTLLATTALACALVAPTAASAAKFQAIPIDCKGKPGCFLLTIDEEIKEGDLI